MVAPPTRFLAAALYVAFGEGCPGALDHPWHHANKASQISPCREGVSSMRTGVGRYLGSHRARRWPPCSAAFHDLYFMPLVPLRHRLWPLRLVGMSRMIGMIGTTSTTGRPRALIDWDCHSRATLGDRPAHKSNGNGAGTHTHTHHPPSTNETRSKCRPGSKGPPTPLVRQITA